MGLGNGLASGRFQATNWTNADLLPMEPRGKISETIDLTLEAEPNWPSFPRRHFQSIFLNENVQISTNISLIFVP